MYMYICIFVCTVCPVPEAPSTVVVEPLSDTSIKVSWKPPATYVNNFIKGYTLQDVSL